MASLRDTEKEITITAPWGKIRGLTWGNPSNPPVLLVPGRIEVCSAFRPLILKLPQNLFYVSIDLPGNGFSDHFPKGLRFTTYDLIPSIVKVQEHFNWSKLAYIGHSLGAAIGKLYNIIYPGHFERIVDLDPVPAYLTVLPQEMGEWYKESYGDHYSDRAYKIHTSGKEGAPTYTYQQVKDILMNVKKMTAEAAECNLERYLEPAGNGQFRFTYDQRMKNLFRLPFTPENLRQMYTWTNVPTLAFLATEEVDGGTYDRVPFVRDESAWPNGNYKYKIVKGNHDVHANDPGCMAEDISSFLLEGLKKSKL